MNLKKIVLTALMSLPLISVAAPQIYQAGTMLNLMHGVYTGSTTLATLAEQGDLGLGTNNGLGGELMMIDSKFYLADSKGNARPLAVTEKTPFAVTTQFEPQQQFEFRHIENAAQLIQEIDKHLASKNLFYVIKIDGQFSSITARSIVPPKKPYQPITDVVKTNQRVFNFNNINGSLIIFKSPAYISPIGVPGYHIHFISDDRKKGGHVFDVAFTNANVAVQEVHELTLVLPSSKEFAQADLRNVAEKDITAIESKH